MRTARTIAILSLLIVWGLVVAVYLAATPADGASLERTCFPSSAWNADDRERPCVAITRLYEDGSARLIVTDAEGDLRYRTSISDPRD